MSISEDDRRHLGRAVALARAARERGDHPFGAVLLAPGGAVLDGLNSVVTGNDVTGHAETNVIRSAGTPAAGSVLYASTEPCAMCAGAIYWSGIGRVVFAMAGAELAGMQPAEAVPPLRLACREVLARGGRPVAVAGPVEVPGAREVHAGFWR